MAPQQPIAHSVQLTPYPTAVASKLTSAFADKKSQKGPPMQEVDRLKAACLKCFAREELQLDEALVNKLQKLKLFEHFKTLGDLLVLLSWQKGLPDVDQAEATAKATEAILNIFGETEVKPIASRVFISYVYAALEAAE